MAESFPAWSHVPILVILNTDRSADTVCITAKKKKKKNSKTNKYKILSKKL